MPDLADLIGQLTSSMIRARVQADLEAVRVAELYASHPYLKHFPVPRFRLPNIDLDVPLALSEPGAPGAPATSGSILSRDDVSAAISTAIDTHLGGQGPALPAAQRKKLAAQLAQVARVERPGEISGDVFEISNVVKTRLSHLAAADSTLSAKVTPEVTDDIARSLRVELLNKRPVPAGLQVVAATSQLREVGRSAEIVRLRMTMTEEAVEWSVEADDGGEKRERLLPE